MTGVLDVFLVIALFSSFIVYVRGRQTRLSSLMNVTTVFILREALIQVCARAFSTHEVLFLALLQFVPVATRAVAGRFPP